MIKRPRLSLAVRLSLYVSAIAICVVGLMFTAFLYYSYRLQVQEIELKTTEIENVYVPPLTTAVWDYAESSVREQIEALHGLRHVACVELVTEEDSLNVGHCPFGSAIAETFTLHHPIGGTLGRLSIEFDRASVREDVARQGYTVSGYVLVPFLVMTVAILVVFRRLVTRHLIGLAQYSRTLTMETLDQSFQFDRRQSPRADELDGLLDSLNTMRTNLLNQIKDRKLAERKLSETERLYRAVYDSTGDAIFIIDGEAGRILDVNRAMLEMYRVDRDRALEMGAGELSAEVFPYTQAEANRRMNLALTGEPQLFEWLARRGDDDTFWVEIFLKAMEAPAGPRVLAAVRDISERKAAEQELNQFQKMESVGQLAGGIAHDFNNLLSGILGSAELLSLQTRSDEDRELAEMIINTTQRAAELTGRLLAFSRKGVIVAGPVDLHEVVLDVVTILQHSIDKRIALVHELEAEPHVVTGDRSQLQNAIMNLALNARDAMADGGTLTIATRNIELDEARCSTSLFELQPGAHLVLTVADTGVGIDSETRDHIFEPFFTTKDVGKGTGLGLATVYGTIKEHHGSITVASRQGLGTTFTLILPADSTDDLEAQAPLTVHTGTGCILLVDDEETVRLTAARSLRSLGYEVILARDGSEGVAMFTRRYNEIDLVILDMIMPKMSGRQAFLAMREVDPAARILIASGYSHHESMTAMLNDGVQGFLRKPYRRADLSSVVANALAT